MQLIRSESFVSVSVCQCDSGSSKATAQLDTVDLAPSCAQRPQAFHNQTLTGNRLSFGLLSQITAGVTGSSCFQSLETDSWTFLSPSSLEPGHVSPCCPFPSNDCQAGLIRGVPADLWSDTQRGQLTLGGGVPLCHRDTPDVLHPQHRQHAQNNILQRASSRHPLRRFRGTWLPATIHAFRVSGAWQRLKNKRKRNDRKGEQADRVRKGCQWKLLPQEFKALSRLFIDDAGSPCLHTILYLQMSPAMLELIFYDWRCRGGGEGWGLFT